MQYLYIFAFLLFAHLIQALSIGNWYNEQTVYTLKRVTEANKWNLETEYDVYQTIMDYYENIVDKSISSTSEHLLLNLIHLPREELNMALDDQMELIGLNDIPEESLFRIPAIIGKHIHEMNAHIYSLVQSLVLKNWHTVGLSDMIYSKHKEGEGQEEEESSAISFMTSFNSAMAKSLLDEIKNYGLKEKIKQDVSNIIPSMTSSSSSASLLPSLSPIISASSSHPSYIYQILQSVKTGVSHFSKLTRPRIASNDRQLKGDFLSEYISNMETDLLIELHTQFYDFYTQVKADLQTFY